MRCFLLLVLLIVPAHGDDTKNCTEGLVANVTVEYPGAYQAEVEWQTTDTFAKCGSKYRVCLETGGETVKCANTSLYEMYVQTDLVCANYTARVAALGQDGTELAVEDVTFLSASSDVRNVTVVGSTRGSLEVAWSLPQEDACVSGYVVSWRLSSEVQLEDTSLAPLRPARYNVTGLRPCLSYDVGVRPAFPGGEGGIQRVSGYTAAQGYPAMVGDLKVTEVSSSEVSLSWSAPAACIESYRTCVRQFFHVNKTCWSVPASQLNWTSPPVLLHCANYSTSVAAVDYSGNLSGEKFTTIATAPGGVSKLRVTSRSADAVAVAWSGPDGDTSCFNGYEVHVCARTSSTCDHAVVELGPGETAYTATSLDACRDYDVVVRSVGAGKRRSSAARISTITDAADLEGVIGNLTVTVRPGRARASQLKVNWTAEAEWQDCVTGYRVCLEDLEQDGGSRSCDVVSASSRRWEVLVRYCGNYSLHVAPLTATGGQLSRAVLTPPGAVRNLSAGNASYEAVHVRWEPPSASTADCVRQYVVRWCSSEEVGNLAATSAPRSAFLAADTTQYSVSGLHNCARYLVWVTALSAGGIESQPAYTHASAGYIRGREPMQNLRVQSAGSEAARVTWDVPRESGYCVTEYRACLEEKYAEGGSQPLSCSTLLSSRGYWDSEYDLQPCTMYTLRVTPHNAAGGWMDNYTLSFATGPASVRSLSEHNMESAVSELRWVAPVSRTCLRSYMLCWRSSGPQDSQETCNTTSADATASTVADLVGCTAYTAAVTAVGSVGDITGTSDVSTVNFTTSFADPGGLSGLKSSATTSNAIQVEWGAPTRNVACVSDYEVCLRLGPGNETCELVSKSQLWWSSEPRLEACSTYDVAVAYRHGTTEVDRTSTTQDTGPAEVEDLALSSRTGTSIAVSWRNPVDNARCAEEVVVSWCYEDPSSQSCQLSGEKSVTMPANTTQFNVTDLLPCSNYSISVGVAMAGDVMSTNKKILLNTSHEMLSAVREVSVEAEETTAVVRWLEPSHAPTCVAGYQVCWRRRRGPATTVCRLTASSPFLLEGELACDVYVATVTVVASDGSLSPAANASVDLGVPGKVENVAVARRSCWSVAVEWDAPATNADCVSGYEVCWGPDSASGASSCVSVSYEDIDVTIHDLRPRSLYRLSLAAVGSAGEKSEALVVRAETGPVEVEDLTLSDRTVTSIAVSWSNAVDNARCAEEAMVSWCYEDPSSQSCQLSGKNSVSMPANTTQFNVTDLLPCSNYSISVGVAMAGNVTSPDNTVSLHTSYESAAAVDQLEVQTNGSAALLTWEPPPTATTCVRGYQVCWRPQDESSSLECILQAAQARVFQRPACAVYVASVRTAGADDSLSSATSVRLDFATPSEARDVTATRNSSGLAEVRWRPPLANADCVSGYEVCVSAAGNATCERTAAPGATTLVVATPQPGVVYVIAVAALGPAGARSAAATAVVAAADIAGHSGGSRLGTARGVSLLACCGALLLLGQSRRL